MRTLLALPLVLLCLPTFVRAESAESRIKLKPGPGRQSVAEKCVLCHSLDYIPMNAPVLDRKGWESEVLKMRKVMGAPIADDEIAPLVDYLAKNYSRH